MMKPRFRRPNAASFLVIAFALAGCAPPGTSVYTESQIGRAATVMHGKVLAIRTVTLQGDSSGAGALTGAVAGGAAGTMVSGDPALAVAGAAGGVLVGGVAGAVAEEQFRRAGGVELIVQQENGQTIAVAQTNEQALKVGDSVLVLRSDKVRIIRDETIRPTASTPP
jgi:outer membrane lipoprotein SlyB